MSLLSEQELLLGFGCPQIRLDTDLMRMIVVEHGRELIRLSFATGGALPETLRTLFESWVSSEGTVDQVWNLQFGELLAAALYGEESNRTRAMTGLALRLSEEGVSGRWAVKLGAPSNLQFDRWILPKCSAIEIVADATGVSASIIQENGKICEVHFKRTPSGWASDLSLSLQQLAVQNVKWPILVSDCISSPIIGSRLLAAEAYSLADPVAAQEIKSFLDTAEAALTLLKIEAPIYFDWVATVIRGVLPLPVKEGVINGASGYVAPGVISLSNQRDPVLLAEFLVHEATHQYFYILRRLGTIDDGTDEALHYSPFKNTGRPLLYIVLTYHAFGNVLLFYKMLSPGSKLGGCSSLNLSARIATLEQNLAVLEETLLASKALTPLGSALWEPIYRQLHE